jgi:hypothetical protein
MAHFRDTCCHLGHTESSGTCAGRRRHIRRAGKWSGLLPTPGASRHRPFGRFVTSSSGMRMLHQHHVGVSAWVSATGARCPLPRPPRRSPCRSRGLSAGDLGLQSVGFDSVGVECLTDEFECGREIFFEGGPDLARRKDEPTFGLAAGTQFDGQ